jgi:hypothetical protein
MDVDENWVLSLVMYGKCTKKICLRDEWMDGKFGPRLVAFSALIVLHSIGSQGGG